MTNQTDIKIVESIPKTSVELIPVFSVPIQFNVTDAAIAELRVKYEVKPVTNTKELKDNAASIAVIRRLRVNIDKKRKTLKKDAIEYGNRVQKEANRITEELFSIEDPLKEVKEVYEAKKAAIAEEKKREEDARIKAVKDTIENIRLSPAKYITANTIQIKKAIECMLFMKDEFNYQEFAQEALQVKTTVIDELKQLQTKREELDKQEKEAEEKQIVLDEQEAVLKVEREKLAIERAEAEQKANEQKAEAARLVKIEQDKLAKERQEILDAQAALQAALQAEQLAKEQAIKETALLKPTEPPYEARNDYTEYNLLQEYQPYQIMEVMPYIFECFLDDNDVDHQLDSIQLKKLFDALKKVLDVMEVKGWGNIK